MCIEFRSYKHCTGQKPLRMKLIRCVRNTHTTCTYNLMKQQIWSSTTRKDVFSHENGQVTCVLSSNKSKEATSWV